MKSILLYIRTYIYETDKRVLAAVSGLTALLIFTNYHFGLDEAIRQVKNGWFRLICRYAIFLFAFTLPYLFYKWLANRQYFNGHRFRIMLFLAPAIFALKVTLNLPFHFSDNPNWNQYWENVVYWPLLVLITGSLLFIIWRIFDRDQPFYGLQSRGLNWEPYFGMLLIMMPLIAAASTQRDFLEVYPKLKLIAGVFNEPGLQAWHKWLFELSYGSDFLTIELFFRGFLVLAFIKWAGKDAILPMACFYCTIHFGKPLGECISSYFGGLLLGIVIYHTRSLLGGLLVHVGIAWLMELGGYIGNAYSPN